MNISLSKSQTLMLKEIISKLLDYPRFVWFSDYEGESNENRKTEIKIRNIAPLSYKLADMLPML
jgi:hypothetical protein